MEKKWNLLQAPSPQSRLLSLEGYLVLFEPKDASLTIFQLAGESLDFFSADILQGTGAVLTSPVIAGRHLIWGSEHGLWGVPLYKLTTSHPQLLPDRLSELPVVGALMSDGDLVMWRTEEGLRAFDPIRKISWHLKLTPDLEPTCFLLGHRLTALSTGGGLAIFRLSDAEAGAEAEMVQISRSSTVLPHALAALQAVGHDQLLGLMDSQPVRFLLREGQPLMVAPVTLTVPHQFNRLVRAESLSNTTLLLVHDSGWEVFDGDSGMVAAGAGKHMALMERRPEVYVRGKTVLSTRLAQDTAVFQVELYDLGSNSRLKFVPGFQNVFHATCDSRWLSVVGQLDGQIQLTTYDLCESI